MISSEKRARCLETRLSVGWRGWSNLLIDVQDYCRKIGFSRKIQWQPALRIHRKIRNWQFILAQLSVAAKPSKRSLACEGVHLSDSWLSGQVDAHRSPSPIVATASRHSSTEPTPLTPHRRNVRIWNKTQSTWQTRGTDFLKIVARRSVGTAGTTREQPGEENSPDDPRRS